MKNKAGKSLNWPHERFTNEFSLQSYYITKHCMNVISPRHRKPMPKIRNHNCLQNLSTRLHLTKSLLHLSVKLIQIDSYTLYIFVYPLWYQQMKNIRGGHQPKTAAPVIHCFLFTEDDRLTSVPLFSVSITYRYNHNHILIFQEALLKILLFKNI